MPSSLTGQWRPFNSLEPPAFGSPGRAKLLAYADCTKPQDAVLNSPMATTTLPGCRQRRGNESEVAMGCGSTTASTLSIR